MPGFEKKMDSVATLKISFSSIAIHRITAIYGGDDTFSGGISSTTNEVIFMAISTRTKALIDQALGPPVEGNMHAVIATPASLGDREKLSLTALLSDNQAAVAIHSALASGTALATTSATYPKTMMALAMVLGSYDAARDFLAYP